jgi:hypothetical protein
MIPHVSTERAPVPCHGDPIGSFSIESSAAGEVEFHAIFLVVPSLDVAAPGGELIVLPLSADGAPITKHGHTGPSWQWDGNREKPTLSPSIFVGMRSTPPGWHGFVRAGVMETC